MTVFQCVKNFQQAYESLLQTLSLNTHLMKRVGQLPSLRVQKVLEVYQRFRQITDLPNRSPEWYLTEIQIQRNVSQLLAVLTSDELIVGHGVISQASELTRQIANLRLLCLITNQQQPPVNGFIQLIDELSEESPGRQLLESQLSQFGEKVKRDMPVLVKEAIGFFRLIKTGSQSLYGRFCEKIIINPASLLSLIYAYVLSQGKNPKTCVECFSSLSNDVYVRMLTLKSSLSHVSDREQLVTISLSFKKLAGKEIRLHAEYLQGLMEQIAVYAKPSIQLISELAKGYVSSNPERALYIALSLQSGYSEIYEHLIHELYLLIAQRARLEFRACLRGHAAVSSELRLAVAESLLTRCQTAPELQDLSLVMDLFDFIKMHTPWRAELHKKSILHYAMNNPASEWKQKLLAHLLLERCSREDQFIMITFYIDVLFNLSPNDSKQAGELVESFLVRLKANKDLYEWSLGVLALTIISRLGHSQISETAFFELLSKIESPNSRKQLLQRIPFTMVSLRSCEGSVKVCGEIARGLHEDEASELLFHLVLAILPYDIQQAHNIAIIIPNFAARSRAREMFANAANRST